MTTGTPAPKPIITQQKTGWYVTDADGHMYTQDGNHLWYSKTIARDIARAHGGDIVLGDSALGGLKAVVRLPV